MKVTHLGHSCLLVETERSRVLIDPGTFSDFADVDSLDAVLVTHQHPDHLDPEKIGDLLERNPNAELHTDPGTAEQLRDKGFQPVETAAGQEFTIGDLGVRPAGDRHAVIHADLPRVDNVGLVLRDPAGATLFHPGDALDAEPGPVDYLAVPVSAPWCAVKETIDFVRRIAPAKGVVPIHDALLVDGARTMYLTHIGNLGLQGRGEVRDLRGAGATDLD